MLHLQEEGVVLRVLGAVLEVRLHDGGQGERIDDHRVREEASQTEVERVYAHEGVLSDHLGLHTVLRVHAGQQVEHLCEFW